MSEELTSDDVIGIAKSALKSELKVTKIYENISKKYLVGSELADVLLHFAKAEEGHANFWHRFLSDRGFDPDTVRVNELLISLLSFIYGLLGIGLTLKILESGERKVIQHYSRIYNSDLLTEEERTSVTSFLLAELAHEEEFLQYEEKYKFFINKTATIFTQTSGGLVIVISTAIGLSSVYENSMIIGLTGLLVGLTGALNTIVGFYFWGRTSWKIKTDILERIKVTCQCVPKGYLRRIEKYMKGKNYSDEVAHRIAEEALEKQFIERIIAEEEYGIKEEALGNPMESALYAGLFKIVGTILPLLPYFLGFPVSLAIPISIVITLAMLTIVGTLAAIAAEVDVKKKVLDLTAGGLVLSTLTYTLGKSASFLLRLLNIG